MVQRCLLGSYIGSDQLIKSGVHLLRTISPDLLVDFIPAFEDLQKKIICSMLPVYPNPELFNILSLRIKQSGLSIHQLSEIAPAAYVVFTIDFLHSQGLAQSSRCLVEADDPTFRSIAKKIQTVYSSSEENQLYQHS